MIIRITNAQAMQARFELMGRGESFSNQGFETLFNYINENFDENYELDVIEIDSEFTEYSLDGLWNDYNEDLLDYADSNGLSLSDLEDIDEKTQITEAYFRDHTTLLNVEQGYDQPDTYIIAAF